MSCPRKKTTPRWLTAGEYERANKTRPDRRTKHRQVLDELVVGDQLRQLDLGAGELVPDHRRHFMVGILVEGVVSADGVG